MGCPVERAYLVSVWDLREICSGLTGGKHEYKLTCDDEKTAISYNDEPNDLNSICFTFPIVRNLNWPSRIFGKQFPFGEDGLMVCLHAYTGTQIRLRHLIFGIKAGKSFHSLGVDHVAVSERKLIVSPFC